MDDYYNLKAALGQADEYKNGIAIFKIGEGDIDMFPHLFTAYQLWVFKSGRILVLDWNCIDLRRDINEKVRKMRQTCVLGRR